MPTRSAIIPSRLHNKTIHGEGHWPSPISVNLNVGRGYDPADQVGQLPGFFFYNNPIFSINSNKQWNWCVGGVITPPYNIGIEQKKSLSQWDSLLLLEDM